MDLAGKVCVLTGASSGIGRQTALDLASEGARVCIAARREDRLKALAAELGGEPKGHSWKRTDVSRRADARALAQHVESTYGRCHVLVNNAGFGINRPFNGPTAIEDVEKIMATNFLGAVYTTGELLPLLERSTPSHVVNVASMAGRVAGGSPSSYTASKFALVGWSETVHFELEPRGIYVSSVEPGLIPTEGFPQEDIKSDPLMRFVLGSVEEVSGAILDAIKHRKVQRVVPRWYYLLQIPRLVVPPLYRLGQKKIAGPRLSRRQGRSPQR